MQLYCINGCMIYTIPQYSQFSSTYSKQQFGAFSPTTTARKVITNKPLQIGLGTLSLAVAGQYFGGEAIHNISDWAAGKAGSMAGSATEVGFECFTPAMLAKLAVTGKISWKDAAICYLASFGAHELGGVDAAEALTNHGPQGVIDLFNTTTDVANQEFLHNPTVSDVAETVCSTDGTEQVMQYGQKYAHLFHDHPPGVEHSHAIEHGHLDLGSDGTHTQTELPTSDDGHDHTGHHHHHGKFSLKGASIHNIITCQLPAALAHGAGRVIKKTKGLFTTKQATLTNTVNTTTTGWPLNPTEQMNYGAELTDITGYDTTPDSDAA